MLVDLCMLVSMLYLPPFSLGEIETEKSISAPLLAFFSLGEIKTKKGFLKNRDSFSLREIKTKKIS